MNVLPDCPQEVRIANPELDKATLDYPLPTGRIDVGSVPVCGTAIFALAELTVSDECRGTVQRAATSCEVDWLSPTDCLP